MLEKVTEGLSTVIGWVSTLINELFGASGDLAELASLVAIGIAASALFLGVKVIKSLVWGM